MTIFDLERTKKILQDFRARVSIQLPKKDVFPFYPDRSFGDRGDVFTTIRWEKGVKRLDGRRKIAENSIFALAYCALIYDFHDTIAGGVTTITRRFNRLVGTKSRITVSLGPSGRPTNCSPASRTRNIGGHPRTRG